MDESRFRFGVGVLVVSAVGIAVILTFFFGAFPQLMRGRYTVTVNFARAPGIGPDTPVQKNGVRIGRVKSLQLLPDRGVDVTMEIDDRYPLRRSEVPRISSGSLITGDAVVEFLPASPEQLIAMFDGQAGVPPDGQLGPEERQLAVEPIRDEDYLDTGSVSGDPLQMLVGLEDDVRRTLAAIQRAGTSIEQAGTSVNVLAGEVREVFGGEEGVLRNTVERTGEALDEFRTTMVQVRGVFEDPVLRARLEESLERFPRVLDEAQRTLESTQRTLQSFERVGASAERTVQNVERFTEPLADRGEELVETVLETLASVNRSLGQFEEFGLRLGNGNGTLKMLMEDDELYWQIRRVVENVEGATTRIQPILDDVRVLSDKLARDPRQLGLRGALENRSAGLGLK